MEKVTDMEYNDVIRQRHGVNIHHTPASENNHSRDAGHSLAKPHLVASSECLTLVCSSQVCTAAGILCVSWHMPSSLQELTPLPSLTRLPLLSTTLIRRHFLLALTSVCVSIVFILKHTNRIKSFSWKRHTDDHISQINMGFELFLVYMGTLEMVASILSTYVSLRALSRNYSQDARH